jgi:hypothetical protein
MATDVYTYGTVAGVFRRVGWLTQGRRMFDGDTQPPLADVEKCLDDIASEIHANLSKNGYPVNTKASVDVTAPRAGHWLEQLNDDGCASFLLMTNPVTYDPESSMGNPSKYYTARYKNGLEMINTNFLVDLALAKTTDDTDMLFSGSTHDDEGVDKVPLFTRAMFDYPSSRSLTDDA